MPPFVCRIGRVVDGSGHCGVLAVASSGRFAEWRSSRRGSKWGWGGGKKTEAVGGSKMKKLQESEVREGSYRWPKLS